MEYISPSDKCLMNHASFSPTLLYCTIENQTQMNATSLMFSYDWFRWWLGAVRQQAITWTSVNQGLCRHMASQDLNELNLWITSKYNNTASNKFSILLFKGHCPDILSLINAILVPQFNIHTRHVTDYSPLLFCFDQSQIFPTLIFLWLGNITLTCQ